MTENKTLKNSSTKINAISDITENGERESSRGQSLCQNHRSTVKMVRINYFGTPESDQALSNQTMLDGGRGCRSFQREQRAQSSYDLPSSAPPQPVGLPARIPTGRLAGPRSCSHSLRLQRLPSNTYHKIVKDKHFPGSQNIKQISVRSQAGHIDKATETPVTTHNKEYYRLCKTVAQNHHTNSQL